MPVAVYPLTGTSPEAVRTWSNGELRRAMNNGARSVAASTRATKVEVSGANGDQVVAAHFPRQSDATQGDRALRRFWEEFGVGALGSPEVVPDEQWGVRPDAVMVW
jgi:hypothetical protein